MPVVVSISSFTPVNVPYSLPVQGSLTGKILSHTLFNRHSLQSSKPPEVHPLLSHDR